MRVLIFGSNGMLGRELSKNNRDGYTIIEVKKEDCDLLEIEKINEYIVKQNPEIVINAAGVVNINLCESDKISANKINALSVLKMALACNQIKAKFIQISTDHFYIDDAQKKHKESDYVTIKNYYACTKFIAESYAALADNHLIIRSNIVGFKEFPKKTSFLDWAIAEIINQSQMTLFKDYYCSSIDIYNFSSILWKAVENNLVGLYNVASSDVLSKAEFILMLSEKFGIPLNAPIFTNIKKVYGKDFIQRATTNGLDTRKIQYALKIKMPSTKQVIEKIKEVYDERYE